MFHYFFNIKYQFQECDKKVLDYSKKESTSQAEFNNVCKQIGISGDKIKAELVEKLKELPEIYNNVFNFHFVPYTN